MEAAKVKGPRARRMEEPLDALAETEGAVGAVLASEDGFALASRLPGEQDAEGLAAAAAAVGQMASETLATVGKGALEVATVEASRLTFLLRRLSFGFLVVLAEPDADMAAMARETNRAAAAVEETVASLAGM